MTDINDLLRLQNPWWQDRTFVLPETLLPKRDLFVSFKEEVLGIRQVSSLIGLRRTGKSTMLRQVIAGMLSSGIDPKSICYFSFEEPTIQANIDYLDQVIQTYLNDVLRLTNPPYDLPAKIYIFFDEIQFVPYWQNIIKRYYDLSDKVKFVVSGSSSLFIRQEAKESLAGRLFEHLLPPLSFSEYLRLKPAGDFSDYLAFGGFPEAIQLPSTEKKVEYLKNWVVGKVLETDIPKSAGVRNQLDFERLFWSLIPNTGQVIAFPKLAVELGLSRTTLHRYLKLLEDTLLVKQFLNTAGSFRSTSRLARKIYPASPNFLSLVVPFPGIGFQAETYAAQILGQRLGKSVGIFRQREKEVDFVIPDRKLAIEVKYQSSLHPSDYKYLKAFVEKKGFSGLILTKNVSLEISSNLKAIPLENLEDEKITEAGGKME